MKLAIESTETGTVLQMKLETSIENLKHKISLLIPIQPQDQILLIGPPYKILDFQYGANLQIDGRRIFIFDRKILIDLRKEPQKIRLAPFEVPIPKLVDENISTATDDTTLLKLTEAEIYVQNILIRGQCFESFIQDAYIICKSCVKELKVQIDGVNAAVSNLKDSFTSIAKTFESLEKKISRQQNNHKRLNDNFENNINRLSTIELHPAIINAVEKFKSEGGDLFLPSNDTTSQSTFNMNASTLSTKKHRTLYDCIPIEREKAFWLHSVDSYQKSEESINRIRLLFNELNEEIQIFEMSPLYCDETVQMLQSLETIANNQIEDMIQLRKNYQSIYESTIAYAHLIDTNTNDDESASTNDIIQKHKTDCQQLLDSVLLKKSEVQREDFISRMENRIQRVKEAKNFIENSKNLLNQEVYNKMRRIAVLQNEIHNRFKRDIEWMKKWTSKDNRYISHLEPITRLPQLYHGLLTEIVRRSSYNQIFETSVIEASEKIATFRDKETKLREVFMQLCGQYLPPIFFSIIPTLKDKPPYFNPSITEAQWLPAISYNDLNLLNVASIQPSDNNVENSNWSDNAFSNTDTAENFNPITDKDTKEGDEMVEDKHIVLLSALDSSAENHLSYEELFSKYNQLVYDNTKLMTIITENQHLQNYNKRTASDTSSQNSRRPSSTIDTDTIKEIKDIMSFSRIEKTRSTSDHVLVPEKSNTEVQNLNEIKELKQEIEELKRKLNEFETNKKQIDASVQVSEVEAISIERKIVSNEMVDHSRDCEVDRDDDVELAKAVAESLKQAQHDDIQTALAIADEMIQSTKKDKDLLQLEVIRLMEEMNRKTSNFDVIMTSWMNLKDILLSDEEVQDYIVFHIMNDQAGSPNTTTSLDKIQFESSTFDETFRYHTAGGLFQDQNSSSSSPPKYHTPAETLTVRAAFNQVFMVVNNLVQGLRLALKEKKRLEEVTKEQSVTINNNTKSSPNKMITNESTNVTTDVVQTSPNPETTINPSGPSRLFVALNDFRPDDIALFISANYGNRSIWLAFHTATPNRYLSKESLKSFFASSRKGESREYILARLYYIEEHIASDEDNPYELHVGTKFYVCYGDKVTRPTS